LPYGKKHNFVKSFVKILVNLFKTLLKAPHRPNVKVDSMSVRNHGHTEMSIELYTSVCGVNIPEMTILAEPGTVAKWRILHVP